MSAAPAAKLNVNASIPSATKSNALTRGVAWHKRLPESKTAAMYLNRCWVAFQSLRVTASRGERQP